MNRATPAPENLRKMAQAAIASKGLVLAAASYGLAPATLARVVGAQPVTQGTVERIAPRVRTADEFLDVPPIVAPRRELGALTWDLETIRRARDEQMNGHFSLPVQLAKAFRTDDALFTAYHRRLAPQSSISSHLKAYDGARGERAARKAQSSVIVPRSVLKSINGRIANHGIAIGYVKRMPRADGTVVDMQLTEWPLEHVRWNAADERLQTATRGGPQEWIFHGDGRWIVFRKTEIDPWAEDACLLSGSFVWAAHAMGLSDWAAGSKSHGQAKIMGELPQNVSLQERDGDGLKLSPEAQAFLNMLQDMISGETGVGVRPFGAKTDFLANGSTAWQVFSELVNDRSKAAQRIYTGTDAALGSVGGAPGVDISELFGVSTTIVQGDFQAIADGLNTGLYQPWTAVNYGDSTYSPCFEYELPDPDAEQESVQQTARYDRFFATLAKWRQANMVVTQEVLVRMAKDVGLDHVPTLGRTPLDISQGARAAAITVNEVRDDSGLPPITGEHGAKLIPIVQAVADAQVQQAKAAATGAAQVEVKAAPAAPGAPA